MRERALRRFLVPLVLMGLLFSLNSCATKQLLRWADGKTSVYAEPAPRTEEASRPVGTILAFPACVAWDLTTFPFQWLFGFDPFGPIYDQDAEDEFAEQGKPKR